MGYYRHESLRHLFDLYFVHQKIEIISTDFSNDQVGQSFLVDDMFLHHTTEQIIKNLLILAVFKAEYR